MSTDPRFIDEEDLEAIEDGPEEVRTIAGKTIDNNNKLEKEKDEKDIIMHLVNAGQDSGTNKNDTISIRISNKDVNAVVEDDNGVEHPVPDLDLQIEIPRSKVYNKNSTLRRRFR